MPVGEKATQDAAKFAELPLRTFLYTLDQVAYILNMDEQHMKNGYIHFVGLTAGASKKHLITARSIGKPGERNDWRVAETELVRWMKLKGFRFRVAGRIVD